MKRLLLILPLLCAAAVTCQAAGNLTPTREGSVSVNATNYTLITSNFIYITIVNTSKGYASNLVRILGNGSNTTVTMTSTNGTNFYTVHATDSNHVAVLSGTNTTVSLTSTNGTNFYTVNSTGGGASLTGSTNFVNLSVQAAKLPATNYPRIDAGWQDWELIYFRTNAEGATVDLGSTFQFVAPSDYATNSGKLRIYSALVSTNGPNSSNTIFGVSVLRFAPDGTTDLHTGSFGSEVFGTNTWSASPTSTNKVQSVLIDLGTVSGIGRGDLCILKVARDVDGDTVGGATAVVGLQFEYSRQ